jgi:hypothetical protein
VSEQDRLAEIQARLAAASPGPWWWDTACGQLHLRSQPWPAPCLFGHGGERHPTEDLSKADADLIEHAPADIDWLVGEVETWRKAWEIMAPELKASIRQQLGLAHLDHHGRPARLT